MTSWRRILGIDTLILLVWIIGFAVYQMSPLTDPDTPWHFATGLFILQHHYVPTQDVFSWTATGKPWVTQEWLFEVVLAWLGSHLGFAGVWLLLCVVHTITVLVLYRVMVHVTQGNRVIAALCACAGTLVGLAFWTMRPQSVSYMMFAVFLLILQHVREGRFRVLWFVPLLMLIWANAHGSSTIGILMLLLEVMISFVPTMGRLEKLRLPKGARIRLLLAAVVAILVGLINPNGIHAYTYALLSTNTTMVNNINEWHSPDFHSDIFKYGVLPFFAVLFLLAVGRRRSLPIRETLYFIGALCMTLIYQRFTPYMGIVAALLLACTLPNLFRGLMKNPKWMMICNAVLCVATFVYLGTQLPSVKGSFDDHLDAGAYPVAAVDYLEKHHLTKNLLNAYHWGGYLIYRGVPTFVDGRTDVFLNSNNVFSDYLAIQNVWWNGPDLIDMYHCQVALLPSGWSIVTYLSHQPDWKVIYRDNNAVILQKNDAGSTTVNVP